MKRASAVAIAKMSWSDDENESDGHEGEGEGVLSLPAMTDKQQLQRDAGAGKRPDDGAAAAAADDDNLAVTLGPLSSLRNKNSVLQFQNQDFQYRVLRRLSVQAGAGQPEGAASPARSLGTASPNCKPAPAAVAKLKKLSPLRQAPPVQAHGDSPPDERTIAPAITPSAGSLLLTAGSPVTSVEARRRSSIQAKNLGSGSGKRPGTPEGLQPIGRGARLQPRRLSALVVGGLEGGPLVPDTSRTGSPVVVPDAGSLFPENTGPSGMSTARRKKELQPLSMTALAQERGSTPGGAVLSPRSMNTMPDPALDNSCPSTTRGLARIDEKGKPGVRHLCM
jgi:hypothetical protein